MECGSLLKDIREAMCRKLGAEDSMAAAFDAAYDDAT